MQAFGLGLRGMGRYVPHYFGARFFVQLLPYLVFRSNNQQYLLNGRVSYGEGLALGG
jgi:hypothetical protein